MAGESYRFRYKKGDMEIELEGSREFVELYASGMMHVLFKSHEAELVTSHEEPSETGQASPIPGSTAVAAHPVTLVEFHKTKAPANQNDRVMVFAYWLTVNESKTQFSAEDIVSCYTKVSVPKPANPGQHLAWAVKQAFLERVEEGAYRITITGKKYVTDLQPTQKSP